MSTVTQATSNVVDIRRKVRRLTASPSPSTISDASIDEAINTFYTQDFIAAIKTDLLKNRYEFFTTPNVDRYPLNIDLNMSPRAPVYVEGRESILYKTREDFFRLYPRYPQKSVAASGDGTTLAFSFTVGETPFLSQNVVIGTKDSAGNSMVIQDNGGDGGTTGFLQIVDTNISTGDKTYTTVGTVNYVTGAFAFTYPVNAPGAGEDIIVYTSFYTVGFPLYVLYWNKEFTVRPVPDSVYRIEVETYLTPMQFILSSSTPEVSQWWQYIAYGAALEILRERGDAEGINELMEGFKRQEALVLERQANAEIGTRNETEFTRASGYGNPYSFYGGWW